MLRTNIHLVVVAALLGDQIACGEGPSPAPSAARAAVLAREDLSAVRAAVTAERKRLGSKAGEPEDGVSDRADGWERLTRAEAMRGFTPHFAIDKLRWWKVCVDPMTIILASQQCVVVEREPRGQAAQGKMSAKLKLVLTRKNAYFQLDEDSVTVPHARWCRGRAIPARLGAGAATRPIGG